MDQPRLPPQILQRINHAPSTPYDTKQAPRTKTHVAIPRGMYLEDEGREGRGLYVF